MRERNLSGRLSILIHHIHEPFDALDADGIATLNALLAEHAARGGATLLTSHQALSLAHPVPRELDLDRHIAATQGRPVPGTDDGRA